jgi:hypothetical protein
MNVRKTVYSGGALLALLISISACGGTPETASATGAAAPAAADQGTAQGGASDVPKFVVDPTWPKTPLPNKWTFGETGGISVDSQNHIWVAHRPWTIWGRELAAVTGEGECCTAAPSIIEFDQAGNVVQSWPELQKFKAKPGTGVGQSHPRVGPEGAELFESKPGPYGDWGRREHTVVLDAKNNAWVANDESHVIYKFTRDGKHLLTIGEKDKTGGSNNTKQLGRPAGIAIDDAANEIYVSDGYTNRRVIVFDMDSGAYKRHWGAYGTKPDDAKMPEYSAKNPPSKQFDTVHGIAFSKDGKVYVADRGNNRVQVFDKTGKFLQEAFVAKETVDVGSVYGVAISPDQKWVYVNDGSAGKIRILRRENLEEVGSFGSQGRHPGQFLSCHSMTVDQQGNIYVAESRGRRIQRFKIVS